MTKQTSKKTLFFVAWLCLLVMVIVLATSMFDTGNDVYIKHDGVGVKLHKMLYDKPIDTVDSESVEQQNAWKNIPTYIPIVVKRLPINMSEMDMPVLDEIEVEMLACTIYQEAGGNKCSDLCRMYVGDVVLNRIESPYFPDTMEEVLTAYRQYGTFYKTGVVWPERANNPLEKDAVERAYRIARALLSGEHSDIYGQGYVWQAEFEQGKDIIYLDGIYFGRK